MSPGAVRPKSIEQIIPDDAIRFTPEELEKAAMFLNRVTVVRDRIVSAQNR
ncbi:MAG: hypothetical protein NTU61_05420 [Candidatus Altiarchaeota archaeon]|nr:hypothetical protein [Candidatus Altiarchaeota archaeon]